MKKIIFVLVALSFFNNTYAVVKPANPSNYTTVLSTLVAGDTMLLQAGNYLNRLTITNKNGTVGAPIVIMGAVNNGSVFIANAGGNTISIKTSSYIIIKNLKLDGKWLDYIDGVKAEGTAGNWTHHITLDKLLIVHHGGTTIDNQTCGISTKCTSWDWAIRNCTIDSAGTGMYLGNSTGGNPFVNSIIENNLVTNSQGYNIQIKHQLDGLRTFSGMTLNGKTIIRYNVFSKDKNSNMSSGYTRPNVLLGAFPSTGDGSNDYYEVYGNFFYQNPSDALLQITGNSAVYSNIFYNNQGQKAVAVMSQNGFAPRKISVFHNSVIINTAGGISFSGLNAAYAIDQHCYANAVFASGTAISSPPANNGSNITDTYINASTYLTNVTSAIPGLNAYPKAGQLTGTLVSSTAFQNFTNWDKDFNGDPYNWIYRGAYSGSGSNPGWTVNIEIRPPFTGIPTMINDNVVTPHFMLFPNPATEQVVIINDSNEAQIIVMNVIGEQVYFGKIGNDKKTIIDVSSFSSGIYFVNVITNQLKTTEKLQVIH